MTTDLTSFLETERRREGLNFWKDGSYRRRSYLCPAHFWASPLEITLVQFYTAVLTSYCPPASKRHVVYYPSWRVHGPSARVCNIFPLTPLVNFFHAPSTPWLAPCLTKSTVYLPAHFPVTSAACEVGVDGRCGRTEQGLRLVTG